MCFHFALTSASTCWNYNSPSVERKSFLVQRGVDVRGRGRGKRKAEVCLVDRGAEVRKGREREREREEIKKSWFGALMGACQGEVERGRVGRIKKHAHPGSPYVFGVVRVDHDLDFPEPMPVIASGYCINPVLETMKTYSSEDGLTEEALVTKLCTCRHHHLFVHISLSHSSSVALPQALVVGENMGKEAYCGENVLLDVLNGLKAILLVSKKITCSSFIFEVKELYGLDDEIAFRNVTMSSENRPRSLILGTATQIGLPRLYVRDLPLNPPAYEIASSIQGSEKCSYVARPFLDLMVDEGSSGTIPAAIE
ncbi:hypothetical protein FNV43_RR00191 [Rhamnella rubrinervis]|uniref:Uncharacterized protein n=1 Tax=Rhamnella rubrinervis TaxID=2594499 RepID=A0A8K0HNQ1_9ROSA|nr:hypothetical protein FNV43_RR00191 [Rhamnella rubrinervis]